MKHIRLFTLALILVIMLVGVTIQAQEDRIEIRWFVGLGAGSDAPKIPLQEAFVEAFNASQNEIDGTHVYDRIPVDCRHLPAGRILVQRRDCCCHLPSPGIHDLHAAHRFHDFLLHVASVFPDILW